MRKDRLIPFSFTPASWGLKGPAYEEAETSYYYEGIELDIKLAQIRYRNEPDLLEQALLKINLQHKAISQLEYEIGMLKLDKAIAKDSGELEYAILQARLEHEDIDPYDFDCEVAKLNHPDADSVEFQVAMLDVDLAHEKITQNERDKQRAILLEEPWIGIVDHGFDLNQGINGVYFEFDWNDYWIVFLRMNGYTGATEAMVVDMWFADVCRSQGVNAMQMHDDGSVIPFSSRAVNKTPD